jgi:dihydrodipicolinate synthase/N-acetylneuraminate lyase
MKKILNSKSIKGPVLSIITPFLKNEKIDYKNLYIYLQFYYERGCRVFYIMAYNSRLTLMSSKEIEEFNIKIIKFLKSKYLDIIIIAAEGVENSTNETIRLCKKYEKAGADMVSVIFGEKYYSDSQVFEHFKKVNKNSNIKLLLHLQKISNGMSNNPPVVDYKISLVSKIMDLKNFLAIKEDVKDFDYTKKILKITKQKSILIRAGGGMEVFAKIYKHGCQAWLTGVGCLDPKISIDFYNSLLSKDYKFCNQIINKIERPFFKMISKYGWHIAVKSCLCDMNLMEKFERSPLKELNRKEHNEIVLFMNNLRKVSKSLGKNYFQKM